MFALLIAAGCAPTPDPIPSLDPIDPSEVFASRFSVQVSFDGTGATLNGSFADRVPVEFHTPDLLEGACRIMAYTPSSCDPACTPAEACVDGTCEPYPVRSDRGEAVWSWPGGTTAIQADPTGGYFGTASGIGSGDHGLAIDGLGAEVEAIEAPLPTEDWTSLLEGRGRGESVTLAWSNPAQGARVRLRMTDCTGSHGGLAPNEIDCDAPDTGELVLHGSIMDVLEDGDWNRGECGSQLLERYVRVGLGEDAVLETVTATNFFYYP